VIVLAFANTTKQLQRCNGLVVLANANKGAVYTLNQISLHSLRAGGAMAMKLNGASDSTIMRVGRWSLLTYLTYIHSQISALTAGLSKLMVTQVRFQNVG
jgi:hypothetical protein